MRRMMVVAGGSGGHLYPAVTVFKKARSMGAVNKIEFATDSRCREIAERELAGETVTDAYAVRLDGGNFNLKSVFLLIISVVKAVRYLRKKRIDLVLGFGGYPSVPFLAAARLSGIRCFSHEQNASMGRANVLLKKFGVPILMTFRSKDCLNSWVGYPLRRDLNCLSSTDSKRSLGLDPGKRTALFIGGSQGSDFITSLAMQVLDLMPESVNWQILLISGVSAAADSKQADQRLVRIHYCHDMSVCYSASDMAVSRAGSGVIHEIVSYRLPAVLVPYPHSAGHQRLNAYECANMIDEGSITVIEQSETVPQRVLDLMLNNKDRIPILPDAVRSQLDGASNILGRILS